MEDLIRGRREGRWMRREEGGSEEGGRRCEREVIREEVYGEIPAFERV